MSSRPSVCARARRHDRHPNRMVDRLAGDLDPSRAAGAASAYGGASRDRGAPGAESSSLGAAAARQPADERSEREADLGGEGKIGGDADQDAEREAEHGAD